MSVETFGDVEEAPKEKSFVELAIEVGLARLAYHVDKFWEQKGDEVVTLAEQTGEDISNHPLQAPAILQSACFGLREQIQGYRLERVEERARIDAQKDRRKTSVEVNKARLKAMKEQGKRRR